LPASRAGLSVGESRAERLLIGRSPNGSRLLGAAGVGPPAVQTAFPRPPRPRAASRAAYLAPPSPMRLPTST
jgi:hypothetical protein